VELLCQAGADVDHKNDAGDTALHMAAAADQRLVVKMLVRLQARISSRNKEGERPLHAAARAGALASCRALVRGGAFVDALDCKGRSPLRIAKLYRNAEIIRYLAKKTETTWWDLPLSGPESVEFPGWTTPEMVEPEEDASESDEERGCEEEEVEFEVLRASSGDEADRHAQEEWSFTGWLRWG